MWGHHGHRGHGPHGHGPRGPPPYPGPHGDFFPPGPHGPPGNAGMYSGQPQVTLSWVPASNGHIPRGALQVGPGVFVARAYHGAELIPGKAANGHRTAYVAYGSREHGCRDYEVLCDTHLDCFGCNFTWQRSNGQVPHGALIGGYTSDKQPLYIARAMVGGEWVAGKVFEPHRCAYFPHGGVEHKLHDFEILVIRS